MICISFKTVVCCVGLRLSSSSWTSRTVLAPLLQSTVRMSSSASVGLGGSGVFGIYEDITTNNFVCQARLGQISRLFRLEPGKLLDTMQPHPIPNGRGVLPGTCVWMRCPIVQGDQIRYGNDR